MGSLSAAGPVFSANPREQNSSSSFFIARTKPIKQKILSLFPVVRLFGPASFESSKKTVVYLEVNQKHEQRELQLRPCSVRAHRHSDSENNGYWAPLYCFILITFILCCHFR
ncbi:magnesium dechelatase SGR1, chloroplastic-like [Ricinus communis]|uniref:magnesium dechelatase SGR1, chloroplastic-like n=1 Tax=Ricinus communis TaxID=3988 RepID=UPI00201A4DDE|nr:magnesium dechelatase SGR1, chloroplastic-like [Ricinus communis]